MAMSPPNPPGTPGEPSDFPRVAYDWWVYVTSPYKRTVALGRHDILGRAEKAVKTTLLALPDGSVATAEIRTVRMADYSLGRVVETATRDVDGRVTFDPSGAPQ